MEKIKIIFKKNIDVNPENPSPWHYTINRDGVATRYNEVDNMIIAIENDEVEEELNEYVLGTLISIVAYLIGAEGYNYEDITSEYHEAVNTWHIKSFFDGMNYYVDCFSKLYSHK